MRIIIYRTNGSATIVKCKEFPTLDVLQKIVGGNIEAVRMPDDTDVFVNDEGLFSQMQPNPFLWDEADDGYVHVVGDAVHFAGVDAEGNSVGFPDDGELPMRPLGKNVPLIIRG